MGAKRAGVPVDERTARDETIDRAPPPHPGRRPDLHPGSPRARPAQETKPAASIAQRPTLKEGDLGPAVEELQRLLNARLDPSPGLGEDGDFGAATKAALIKFQESKGLKPTGTTDEATWSALGPPPAKEPVPSPESVNSAPPLKKKPADSLDGPPFVSAKAWAIADGRTGKILWGDGADRRVDIASTTKIMTALIVLRKARADPKVLDEVVTFSPRADKTPGSTAGVKAGETVSVGDLLYGLLLPSGNDAAVAFAEHFGGRCAPPDDRPDETDPLPRFIAEMNRVAAELGLNESHFANPNGLPASGHQSSALDLAKLASIAVADPTFARVVATVRRGARLKDAEGKERNVVWSNTNHLLGIEGYDGVKTGTTNAAGACLVASGRRGEDHLIVVVLGATTSEGRYQDARNLFRWAWNRRIDGKSSR